MAEREAAGRAGGLGGEPAGVGWLILEGMNDLRTGTERMESRLTATVDAADQRRTAGIDRIEAKLDRQAERLDAGIDAGDASPHGRITALQRWTAGPVVTMALGFAGVMATQLARHP
jgi:hypothetical protein